MEAMEVNGGKNQTLRIGPLWVSNDSLEQGDEYRKYQNSFGGQKVTIDLHLGLNSLLGGLKAK